MLVTNLWPATVQRKLDAENIRQSVTLGVDTSPMASQNKNWKWKTKRPHLPISVFYRPPRCWHPCYRCVPDCWLHVSLYMIHMHQHNTMLLYSLTHVHMIHTHTHCHAYSERITLRPQDTHYFSYILATISYFIFTFNGLELHRQFAHVHFTKLQTSKK